MTTTNPPVVFAGHNTYMMSVAKFCREMGHFTDVTLQCLDGTVKAHRLILGAASKFLKEILLQHLDDEETIIVIPDVQKVVLMALLDFLYTGKMMLSRVHTRELQLLVGGLGIDPGNVKLEIVVKNSAQFSQVKHGLPIGLSLDQSKAIESLNTLNIVGDSLPQKTLPVRAVKRRISNEIEGPLSKESKVLPTILTPKPSSTTTTSATPGSFTPSSSGRGRGRARARQSSSGPAIRPGVHDMTRTETWVCAICRFYDPPAKEAPPTTEWIGCDCNRWYHKHCTGLKIVDDSFCCSQVNLKCLPTK